MGSDTTAAGSKINGEVAFQLNNVQGGPGPLASGLIVNGQYTVRVINSSNGCKNIMTVQVADAAIKPQLTLKASPNTICDTLIAGTQFTGKVEQDTYAYTGTYTGVQTLKYAWYDGQYLGVPLTSHTPAPSASSSQLTNLNAGFFSGTVTIDEIGCTSDVVSAEVKYTPDI